MIVEVETDFEGGTEQKDAADFDGKGANLLPPFDEEELKDVADDGETGNSCMYHFLPVL